MFLFCSVVFCGRIFFFSLFHQCADNEALTRLLQTSLFLVASLILVKSMFFSFQVFPDIVHSGLPLSPSASLWRLYSRANAMVRKPLHWLFPGHKAARLFPPLAMNGTLYSF